MDVIKYIDEIKEKIKDNNDISKSIEYQSTIENEILLILTRIYKLYSKKYPDNDKLFYLVMNKDQYIFTSEYPISFKCDNGILICSPDLLDEMHIIEDIIYEIDDIRKLVNIYSDDDYFSLIFNYENKKFTISFQNRFWLDSVKRKLNHIE